jgi:hypothetical protein
MKGAGLIEDHQLLMATTDIRKDMVGAKGNITLEGKQGEMHDK